MRKAITIYNENGDEAAAIYSVRRVRDKLVMDGKALGTMQMDMILNSEDALRAIRLFFTWAVISFALMLPIYALRNALRQTRR
jgi:nitric oxide reductase large subunit